MRREEGDKGAREVAGQGVGRRWEAKAGEVRKRKGREGGGRQKREMKRGERKQRSKASAGFVTFSF